LSDGIGHDFGKMGEIFALSSGRKKDRQKQNRAVFAAILKSETMDAD
jgi:hypothetical protein